MYSFLHDGQLPSDYDSGNWIWILEILMSSILLPPSGTSISSKPPLSDNMEMLTQIDHNKYHVHLHMHLN